MNPQGPVLRDIHLPSAAWWPPAPAWWLLAAAVVLIAAGIAWWLRRRARLRPLRATLREIDAIRSAFERSGDVVRLTENASYLLRRVACRIDRAAASRSGTAWRVFLHRYARDAATLRAIDALAEVRFHATPAVDAAVLLPALRTWCRDALHARAAAARAGTPAQMQRATSP
ncbi:MAG: DUF4381 family protein [Rhodanobacteraceae bacterium]